MTGSERFGPYPLATILALWLLMPKTVNPNCTYFRQKRKKKLIQNGTKWSEVLPFSYKLIVLQFYMEYFPNSLDCKG